MDLHPSIHDPCLFSCQLHQPGTTTPSSPAEVRIGIYVDDFVFYLLDPTQEELF